VIATSPRAARGRPARRRLDRTDHRRARHRGCARSRGGGPGLARRCYKRCSARRANQRDDPTHGASPTLPAHEPPKVRRGIGADRRPSGVITLRGDAEAVASVLCALGDGRAAVSPTPLGLPTRRSPWHPDRALHPRRGFSAHPGHRATGARGVPEGQRFHDGGRVPVVRWSMRLTAAIARHARNRRLPVVCVTYADGFASGSGAGAGPHATLFDDLEVVDGTHAENGPSTNPVSPATGRFRPRDRVDSPRGQTRPRRHERASRTSSPSSAPAR